MEEDEDPSNEYVSAYNLGYQMAKHEPRLLKQVLSSPIDTLQIEYLKALEQGRYQFEKEIFAQEMKDIRTKNNTRKPKL